MSYKSKISKYKRNKHKIALISFKNTYSAENKIK